MFNSANPPNPAVVFFYNQLGEFVNGESCVQNAIDNANDSSIPINPVCAQLGCTKDSTSTACLAKIPGGFQLSDGCVQGSDNTQVTYNPYCDPCCQPASIPNPGGKPNPRLLRPASCTNGDSECMTNNPYGYPDIYDPTFQNYQDQVSFLAQFGRDQQLIPKTANPQLPLTVMTPNVAPATGIPVIQFPDGIYSFFWDMNSFSPQVDSISLVNTAAGLPTLTPAEKHWCTTTVASGYTAPTGAVALTQLGTAKTPFSLPYACSGKDCCVNFLPDSIGGADSSTVSLSITVGTAPAAWQIEVSKNGDTLAVPANNSVGLLVGTDSFQIGSSDADTSSTVTYSFAGPHTYTLSSKTSPNYETPTANASLGLYVLTANATTAAGVSSTASNTITIAGMNVSPVTNTGSTAGSPIVLSATASEGNNGTISKVTFYNGSTVIGVGTLGSSGTMTAPCTCKGSCTVGGACAATGTCACDAGVTCSGTGTACSGSGETTYPASGYTYPSWAPAAGTYSITAVATDAKGISVTGPATSIVISPASSGSSSGSGSGGGSGSGSGA
jgi:hypothetical protein